MRGLAAGVKGRGPRIQMLRRPFFSRSVVMVAVEMVSSVARAAGSSGMGVSLAHTMVRQAVRQD